MNIQLLREKISDYKNRLKKDPEKHQRDLDERKERIKYYQAWGKSRILQMNEEQFYEYMAKLWAMLIWGNKKYYIDKLISDNGFEKLKSELAALIWDEDKIENRWNRFRKNIKGMGPATMSEILCHTHPNECMIWNRRAYVGFNVLGVDKLPRYDYQMTGQKYQELIVIAQQIAKELEKSGVKDTTLLNVDYFIWDELQVEENLSRIFVKKEKGEDIPSADLEDSEASAFIHNEVRDKIAEIGEWLGFKSRTEIKVADGSKVDTIWEVTIGNMGHVIYVFEVQTKGNIDSLILNLMKSLNNPAVQGIVAVSDPKQLEKIEKSAAHLLGLSSKLKYWNYEEVLQIHEALGTVNVLINRLGLVPERWL